MTVFTILLGGEVTPTKRLREQVAQTHVIAADSGMRHAPDLGVTPLLWVGDFDSAAEALVERFKDIPRELFPAEKDATDGDIAITEALKRGADCIILVGATGGQFDHVLCHAVMLQALHRRDIQCWMNNGIEEIYPLQNCTLKGHKAGTRLSIVPTNNITGLSIEGVKWPLSNKSVPAGSSLTLSNETDGDVTITYKSGDGFIVVYPQENS